MKTNKQIGREARKLVRLCIVSGKVDERRVRLVAKSVLRSRHRGYLLLLKRFLRLLEHEYARHTAEIASAVPLPTDLRTRVQTELTAIYGPTLTWSFVHEPALIGGIRIKVGSDVYDGSVQSGFAALARSLGLTMSNGRRAQH
jgi:F-type H+-transporting ATPase subunit delta